MDIKPTKQGLAKIVSKENCQALGINLLVGKNGESGKVEEKKKVEAST